MIRKLIYVVAFLALARTTDAGHKICPRVETNPGEWFFGAYERDENGVCQFLHGGFLDGDYQPVEPCDEQGCFNCPVHPLTGACAPSAEMPSAPPSSERSSASKWGYPGPLLNFGEYRFPEDSTAQVLNHSLQLISLPSGGTEFVDLVTFKFSTDPTMNTEFETAYMAYEVRDPHPLVPTDLEAVEATPVPNNPSVFLAVFPSLSGQTELPVPVRLHRD